MNREITLNYEFVEYVPPELFDHTVYISIAYATATHKCCCGCGNKVITPFSPTDWKLIYDGETISLDPSIGNWNFPCRSHYWITQNKVRWARPWSKKEIDRGRKRDKTAKGLHSDRKAPMISTAEEKAVDVAIETGPRKKK